MSKAIQKLRAREEREHDHVSARLTPKDIKQIEKLVSVGAYLNTADFVRTAVRDKLAEVQVLEIRKVPREKAKKEVLEYLKTHSRAYPSDIADALRLDFDLVLSIGKELRSEGRIE